MRVRLRSPKRGGITYLFPQLGFNLNDIDYKCCNTDVPCFKEGQKLIGHWFLAPPFVRDIDVSPQLVFFLLMVYVILQ